MSTRHVWARHGFLKAIPYALCRLVQRFVLLDITHIMLADVTDARTPTHEDGWEYRFLSGDEVREFAADSSNDLDVDVAKRLDSGYDYCFAALDRGSLAGYCWLALESIEAEHNRSNANPASGIGFSFPNNYAFRYKGYTHPNYRGRRLYQKVAMAASVSLQEKGIDYVISTAEFVNYSALKSSYRCGYEYLGFCVLLGLGRRILIRTPDLSDHEILVGKSCRRSEQSQTTRDVLVATGSPTC